MRVTDVQVALRGEGRLRAFVSIVIDGCFVVRDLKIIEGARGLFVAMPSRRRSDGSYRDISHPVNEETRRGLEAIILTKYFEVREQGEGGMDGAGVLAPLLPPIGPLSATAMLPLPLDENTFGDRRVHGSEPPGQGIYR